MLMVVASLGALQQLGQRVPQLRQLEDLAVQQLQQRVQALVKGFPLLLAALQTLPQIAQLGLQHQVPRLGVLKQTTDGNAIPVRIWQTSFTQWLSNHFL